MEIANKYQESGLTRFSHPNFICDVELHQVFPNDPYFVNQFSLHNTGQVFTDGHFGTPDADIDAPEAWAITRGSNNIIVAVIDEGVTPNHPDLPNVRQVRLNGSNFGAPFLNSMTMKSKTLYLITATLLFSIFACDQEENPFPEEPFDFSIIDSEPAWSPDGQWIAFVHGSMPNDGIYLISPDGEDIHLWHKGIADSPAWSPCGQWIAFSQNAQIWKKKIDGDSLTQLTFEGRNFFPAWNSKGDWIAYDGFLQNVTTLYAVWRMKTDGSGKIIVSYKPGEGAVRMPNWRGDTIVHIRYKQGAFFSSEIFSMDTIGKYETRITYNEATDYYPKLSNVHRKIAFTSQTASTGVFQIWSIGIDGSNLKQLTYTQGYSCDWSPCGSYIVYTDARSVNGRLWIMNADGSNKRQLTFEHHF